MSLKLRKPVSTRPPGEGGGVLREVLGPASIASALGEEQKTLVRSSFVVEGDFCCSRSFATRSESDIFRIGGLSMTITKCLRERQLIECRGA